MCNMGVTVYILLAVFHTVWIPDVSVCTFVAFGTPKGKLAKLTRLASPAVHTVAVAIPNSTRD